MTTTKIQFEKDCKITNQFLTHLFGDKKDVILDYIQIAYFNPKQKLPIIYLASNENCTGKSTFLNWVEEIFGNKSIKLSFIDFISNYNDNWITKQIITVDDSLLLKRRLFDLESFNDVEKVPINKKGKEIREVQFLGKFILATNDLNFSPSQSLNFTLLKIKKIDPFILEKLKIEIPYFIGYISDRELVFTDISRLSLNEMRRAKNDTSI